MALPLILTGLASTGIGALIFGSTALAVTTVLFQQNRSAILDAYAEAQGKAVGDLTASDVERALDVFILPPIRRSFPSVFIEFFLCS